MATTLLYISLLLLYYSCIPWHWVKPRSNSNTGTSWRKFYSLPMLKLWAACQLVLQRDRMRCMLRMIPCRLSSIFNINNSMYDMLWECPSKTGVWKCLACDNLNITTNSLRSLDSYETSNPCEPLDTPNTSNISFSHIQTSSPKFKQQTPSAKQPRKKRKKTQTDQ